MGQRPDEAEAFPRLHRRDREWQGRGERLRVASTDAAYARPSRRTSPLCNVDIHEPQVQEEGSGQHGREGDDGLGKEARLPQDDSSRIHGGEEGLLAAGVEAHLGDGGLSGQGAGACSAQARASPSAFETFTSFHATPASTTTAINARLRPDSSMEMFLPAPKVCTTIRKIAPIERSPW